MYPLREYGFWLLLFCTRDFKGLLNLKVSVTTRGILRSSVFRLQQITCRLLNIKHIIH